MAYVSGEAVQVELKIATPVQKVLKDAPHPAQLEDRQRSSVVSTHTTAITRVPAAAATADATAAAAAAAAAASADIDG